MIEKLIATIKERYALSEGEAELLRSRMTEVAHFGAGQTIVSEGQRMTFSSLLVDGLSCRNKGTFDGSRQIMQFNIAGDFVDLHSYPLECLDHSVTAVTNCQIVKLYHHDITAILNESPRVGRILWFATMVDASMHREWIVSLGTRPGAARIAHLFCEMYYRMRIVGLTDENRFVFPITQADLAEALGFSPVHINRLLSELRNKGLASFNHKTVIIQDLKALEEIAEFDPGYLYLQERTGRE